MRAVVTGGAGFLGSHLTDRLLALGFEVVAVDNFVTGRRENVAHLVGNGRFSLVEHDICEQLVIDGQVDLVFNLASPASPADFTRIPFEVLRVGSRGTENVLDFAHAKGARFVMASTSEVYGDPAISPQPESYWGNVNPIGPRGVYDEAKRFSESMTMAYHRHRKLDTRIIRIFNTYGPRMRLDDERAVPSFISSALRGEPLLLQGSGHQTRSFCYVDDLIDGLIGLAERGGADPVNVGSDQEITIAELAKTILELTGSKSAIHYVGEAPDDPKRRQPDLTLARSLLGYSALIPLEVGLRKTIAHMAREMGIPTAV